MLSVIEINSFLIKFLQLSHDGLDTNLSFNCIDGKMTVNLKATVTSTPGSERTDDGNCQHVKPSRLRHRKRRSEARIKAQNSKNNCTIDIVKLLHNCPMMQQNWFRRIQKVVMYRCLKLQTVLPWLL